MRPEVTALPVANVDRAKAFYEGLGWRLDIDFSPVKSSPVWHLDPDQGPVGGRDPENRSHFSRASFR